MNKKQLWDSILQQAISGKLVPQMDSEPAVEQIGPAPAKDEEPFALPEKWKWVQASYLGSWKSGSTPNRSNKMYWDNGSINWLKTGELQDRLITSAEEKITKQAVEDLNIRINPAGAFLVAMYGATAGKIGILQIPSTTNQACCACIVNDSIVINWFLFYAFLACRASLVSKAGGSAQPNLSKEKVIKTWVPLPPLEEQRRIVAKLDELKPLIDQFGEAYDKLSELEADFPRKLKASILQAAMQGKLVPQLDSEPAVEQIGPALDPDDVPFKLPEKWKWVKLKTIGQIIGGGTPSSAVAEYWDKPTINWITSADLRANKGIFIYSGARSISQLGLQKSSAKLFPAGTVIYTTRGACIGDVAVAALESCTNQGCKSFVPDTAHITSLWGYYALKHAAPFIRRLSSGTTFAEISGKRFSEIAIPLPPLEEQHRIVERIEQLFAEVNKMSACKAP